MSSKGVCINCRFCYVLDSTPYSSTAVCHRLHESTGLPLNRKCEEERLISILGSPSCGPDGYFFESKSFK